MKDLLIVEDDPTLGEGIRLALQAPELRPQLCRSLADAGELLSRRSFDLLILDINLPDGNGLDLLRALRRESEVPVILLTANDLETDIVAGLELGADDYITKPFSIEELLARIRAALRNKAEGAAEVPGQVGKLMAGPLTMDVDRHEVSVNGQEVELTRREFDLLRYLLENKEKVVTREVLLDNVWGFDFVGETNTVDVYIRFLRSKIDERFHIKLIHTVRGVGYVIRED